MSNETEHYQAIIIGAGQAGGPLSTTLARAGWKTALIEKTHVGGTCVNEGCTPTKTMVASARVAHLARRAADYGVNVGAVEMDMKTVRKRKRDIVDSFRGGSQRRIEQTERLDLFFGEAHFAGAKTVKIMLANGGSKTLTADKIFINTGTRPRVPAIPGLENVPYLNSTSIMELDVVPEHLLVIGGGYIGLEFGQMFRRFGSKVTIIQNGAQLLAREDPDVAGEVAEILRQDGIRVLLDSHTRHVEKNADSDVRLLVQTPDGEELLKGSHLLVATGRVPNSDMLHLPEAGVKTDPRGFIRANEKLETTAPDVYVLGDVKGGPAFTHISYDDFRIIRTNLLEKGKATTENRLVPYTVFIDPQLGRVGLSEKEAKKAGYSFRVAKIPMTYVARALETDETRGFMKALVDGDTDQVLGCAILGIEGGEIATVLQMAMMGNIPYTRIRDGVFSHPTLSESLNNLFMAMDS